MICSMNKAEPDPEARGNRDPDLRWTGWALETLREVVEIDMRAKRNVAAQQDCSLECTRADDGIHHRRGTSRVGHAD